MGTRAKRLVYLVHRWTGVAMCLLMAIWFASGMVMLFVGYPKLTPGERLGALPALPVAGCCVAPERALAAARQPAAVSRITLTSIGGHARYLLREGDASFTVVDARLGLALPRASATQALAAARAFSGAAAASYLGAIEGDRWTRSRALNPHRPLHLVELDDAARTRVYVSSSTGQVVLDLPRTERLWNYAGAWLHWLYMLRSQPADPVWTWTIIAISAIGVISAATGVVNGIWRWRIKGTYKNGSRSPFRGGVLRWHHIAGLTFGTFLFTWIFSGLMSMNPVGVFNAAVPPAQARYAGAGVAERRLDVPVAQALALLRADGFAARELEWRLLGGAPFLLARGDGKSTRVLVAGADGAAAVLRQFGAAQLLAAAPALVDAPLRSHAVVERYDAIYYKRGAASMYGDEERPLPALRVEFADPGRTAVYLDPHTGGVALSADRSERVGRWLFNFLHSWDLPALLDLGWAREAALILLSVGGLVLSVSGVLLGYRRVTRAVPKRAPA